MQQQQKNDTLIDGFFSLITSYADSASQKTNQTIISNAYLKYSVDSIKYLMTADNLTIYLILIFVVLRLALYTQYAQAYLNLGFELAAYLRKTTTRITNVKYMSTISSIYQYYGVVASQYVMPLFVVLFLGLLLKKTGNYTWCGDADWCNRMVNSTSDYSYRLSLRIQTLVLICSERWNRIMLTSLTLTIRWAKYSRPSFWIASSAISHSGQYPSGFS